jgi:prepilin-type N-terminal cleavage/methylation domain-containing protein
MKNGFTLTEVLIVVAVITMLAAMLVGIASVIDTQSKEKATEATIALLEGALDEYKDFKDDFPIQPDMNDANAPIHSEYLYGELDSVPASANILNKISDKLIQNKYDPLLVPPKYEIYDLWGTALDYIYEPSINTYPLLRSAGKDKTFNTPDDISNR